jgi:hypothetical protein
VTSRRSFFALSVTTFYYRLLLTLSLAVIGLSQPVLAQQTLGSLNGVVTDPSGAVVQAVAVKAHSTAINLEVERTSRGDGSFSMADLPIGTYEVTFTKDGFQRRSASTGS